MKVLQHSFSQISIIFCSIIILSQCDNPTLTESPKEEKIDSTKIIYVDSIRSVFTWISQNDKKILDDRTTISNGFILPKNDSTIVGQLAIASINLKGNTVGKDSTSSPNKYQGMDLTINNIIPLSGFNPTVDSTFYLAKANHLLLGAISSKQLSDTIPLSFPVFFSSTDSSFLMEAKFSLQNQLVNTPSALDNYRFGFRIEGQKVN
ncbi:MAG: hypothetical protein RIA69_03355 [Cyclobacteriaceae bacterium]